MLESALGQSALGEKLGRNIYIYAFNDISFCLNNKDLIHIIDCKVFQPFTSFYYINDQTKERWRTSFLLTACAKRSHLMV